jgi:hypothetical protein
MTYRIDTLRLAKPKCGRGLQRLRRQGTAGTGPVVNNDGATKNFAAPLSSKRMVMSVGSPAGKAMMRRIGFTGKR